MDIELERKVAELTEYLKEISTDSLNYQMMDPIARMMLVALLHESQKIQDTIDSVSEKILDHFCENFIPRKNVNAMPAVALVAPSFKKGKDSETTVVNSGVSFTYKNAGSKTAIEYLPLFKNTLIPYDEVYVITKNRMTSNTKTIEVSMEKDNIVWVGINTKSELESLKGFSLFIKGCDTVIPKKISVLSNDTTELQFCSMHRLEDIDMLEPFDAQQATGKFMSILKYWKESLQDLHDGSLYYITDDIKDRDVFKRKTFPRFFQNWLENEVLDCFNENTLWLQIEYPENYVVPENCSVILNTLPIVNISVNTVTLTQSSPIAKLQKQEDSFFVQVLETSNSTHKQGFGMSTEEIVIRDFDAACYNNGDLYRDVRNLYNRFVEDYYAFIEYNGLKDGEDIKRLKELINKIGKSVGSQNHKYNFDSGTYVMKNINQYPPTLSTKVSYITTQGEIGNLLQVFPEGEKDHKLECKKMPVIEQNVPVVIGAIGGRDKADADSRYEQVRYYSLTNDRLYTKMDIEAYVRKELVSIYGKEEFKRIYIKTCIEGVGGINSVQRGLYIDIEFKDKKNYAKAIEYSVKDRLEQKIRNKSCISMPIIITLINLEEN